MKVTEYTLDPLNARAIRFLQSRPVQIGEPFATSVALFLTSAGYLSRKQRERSRRSSRGPGVRSRPRSRRRSTTAASAFSSTSLRGVTPAMTICTSSPHATKTPPAKSASG